jgi:hypothetical protein
MYALHNCIGKWQKPTIISARTQRAELLSNRPCIMGAPIAIANVRWTCAPATKFREQVISEARGNVDAPLARWIAPTKSHAHARHACHPEPFRQLQLGGSTKGQRRLVPISVATTHAPAGLIRSTSKHSCRHGLSTRSHWQRGDDVYSIWYLWLQGK